MKKIDKSLSLFGVPVFAALLSCFAFAPAALAGAGNNDDAPVSAIGTPPAATVTTQVVDPAPTAAPTTTDATAPGAAADAGKEFPPQPVSVAPAEEATPAAPTTAIAAPGTSVVAPTAPDQPSAQALNPVPQAEDGSITGTNVMGDSGFEQKHSGTYYDSNAIVPDSALSQAGATGPRKVDPAYEPGQTFIVVEKGASASSFEGQYIAATRALKLGRYAAAMEMFEKLYKKNHKDPRVLMGLAVAQQGAGFSESAARTYEDLLKVQPNNADAIVNLMGLMKTQYPSVTLKKLTELRDKYPMNPGIPAQLGLVNAELKNYDDAIRYFQIAASMDPRNSSHVFNMAIAADKKGNVSEAIKTYEKALQMDASYGDGANALPRKEIYDRLVVLRRKV